MLLFVAHFTQFLLNDSHAPMVILSLEKPAFALELLPEVLVDDRSLAIPR